MEKVLIIEDEEYMGGLVGRLINKKYPDSEVLWATSMTSVMAVIKKTLLFEVILVDGSIPKQAGGEFVATPDLVVNIRHLGYRGPMVAFSGASDIQAELQAAGCDHRCDGKNVMDLSHLLDSIL